MNALKMHFEGNKTEINIFEILKKKVLMKCIGDSHQTIVIKAS